MGAASGEQCRGACSEVLLEEIKEAAPRRVRDVGVVRVERLGLLKTTDTVIVDC